MTITNKPENRLAQARSTMRHLTKDADGSRETVVLNFMMTDAITHCSCFACRRRRRVLELPSRIAEEVNLSADLLAAINHAACQLFVDLDELENERRQDMDDDIPF
ncbi:hypothetical protein XH99_22315 [Bradyrhizobium nanningense]|uniref:Uncharacterized protein n=1 Tax=Bradyrhizobium nanningense TaxID=1325118 RepID=A0A4Q0S0B8_9BRAD|nr:hypothetical protein [Bradyrhizobium nanningense]RXH25844.1 hypothetical protein XH99_22315 [Bradyrhizobium nanningense]RXH28722.1 hypothetical protein XH84_24010 [Bradyrhizobium nanningense]